jgi:hypothetical protein
LIGIGRRWEMRTRQRSELRTENRHLCIPALSRGLATTQHFVHNDNGNQPYQSIMSATNRSGVSVSGSEEEALSQECINEMSSQESLSSGETGKASSTSIDSIPVSLVDPIPESVMQFSEGIHQEPFLTAVKEFRAKWKKHHEHHETRLENPSAFVALDKAEHMRLEFTAVVQNMGSPDQQSQWSNLSPELCDKCLCHVFLPPELGGFLPVYEE